MRTAAEIDEIALVVERDLVPVGDGSDDLGLVVFSQASKKRHGFVARQEGAIHLEIALGEIPHLGLDGL